MHWRAFLRSAGSERRMGHSVQVSWPPFWDICGRWIPRWVRGCQRVCNLGFMMDLFLMWISAGLNCVSSWLVWSIWQILATISHLLCARFVGGYVLVSLHLVSPSAEHLTRVGLICRGSFAYQVMGDLKFADGVSLIKAACIHLFITITPGRTNGLQCIASNADWR